jgi:hypothetical protein
MPVPNTATFLLWMHVPRRLLTKATTTTITSTCSTVPGSLVTTSSHSRSTVTTTLGARCSSNSSGNATTPFSHNRVAQATALPAGPCRRGPGGVSGPGWGQTEAQPRLLTTTTTPLLPTTTTTTTTHVHALQRQPSGPLGCGRQHHHGGPQVPTGAGRGGAGGPVGAGRCKDHGRGQRIQSPTIPTTRITGHGGWWWADVAVLVAHWHDAPRGKAAGGGRPGGRAGGGQGAVAGRGGQGQREREGRRLRQGLGVGVGGAVRTCNVVRGRACNVVRVRYSHPMGRWQALVGPRSQGVSVGKVHWACSLDACPCRRR